MAGEGVIGAGGDLVGVEGGVLSSLLCRDSGRGGVGFRAGGDGGVEVSS